MVTVRSVRDRFRRRNHEAAEESGNFDITAATTAGTTAGPAPGKAAGGPRRAAVDAVPPVWRLAVYGTQHVLAFYAGAMVMPLLVAQGLGLSGPDQAMVVNASLLACGLATVLQSAGLPGVGIRLPVVQGPATSAVPTLISAGLAAGGAHAGLPTVFGAVIAAGLALLLVAPVFSKLVRFFPPLVTGTIVTVVGVTLLAVAAKQVGGGDPQARSFGSPEHLGLAGATLLVVVLVSRFSRGFAATVAVLVGLAAGTVLAVTTGHADFSGTGRSQWFGMTEPLHFGAPRWDTAAVLSLSLVMVVIAVESIGQFFAVGRIVGRDVGERDVVRALRADGLGTVFAGLLNSFPSTVFSQNVGLIQLTRVRSRWVVVASGVLMVALGLMPRVGAVIAAMPTSVLGGATIVLFGTIAVVGVQILAQADLGDRHSTLVVAVSLGVGFLPTVYPQFAERLPGAHLHVIFESGIILGSITAVLLNLLFHHLRLPWQQETPTRVPAPPVDGAAHRMQHEVAGPTGPNADPGADTGEEGASPVPGVADETAAPAGGPATAAGVPPPARPPA
ncbi:purine permease [Streptomyces albus]|uniref:nucleobase:cation symporter-2 family protein n=1 Tax=Streptomyces albus TaxID=1888 RepID=UPI0013B49489|nr:nucleobase:cation symporter-2 family protein [Streptomyces albus]QID34824.1 purine permease [Streptomyces albus]